MQNPRPILKKPKVPPKVDQGKHPLSDFNSEPELAVERISLWTSYFVLELLICLIMKVLFI